MRFRPVMKTQLGNRRDQRRVVMLFGMLVIVVLSISRTSNPRNWEWLTGPAKPKKSMTASQAAEIDKQQERLKANLLKGNKADGPELRQAQSLETKAADRKSDEATADGKGTGDKVAGADGQTEGSPATKSDQLKSTVQTAERTQPADLPGPPDYRIPESVFSEINEESLFIRPREAPAYWRILSTVRDLPQSELEQASEKDLQYSQLFSDPNAYRGHLITLEGELRRFGPLAKMPNDAGIETVYEGWFRNTDSDKHPYVFHCLEKPVGLPEGEQLSEKIQITGYYFKRYQYAAQSGLSHATPMLLAKRIRWFPAVQRKAADPVMVPYILVGLAIVGTVLAAAIVGVILRDQRRSNAQFRRLTESQIANFDSLQDDSHPPGPVT